MCGQSSLHTLHLTMCFPLAVVEARPVIMAGLTLLKHTSTVVADHGVVSLGLSSTAGVRNGSCRGSPEMSTL